MLAIVRLLNMTLDANLLFDYSLPKIKTRFKGEHRAVFLRASRTPLAGDVAVFDGSRAPERRSGPAQRQEGTLVKSFKQRFFLLQSGVLLVYKTEEDFLAGREMELTPLGASFVVGSSSARGKAAPPLCLYVFDAEDEYNFEMLLKFEDEANLQGWKHDFRQNFAYVAYKEASLLF